MLFADLAQALQQLEQTSARLKMTEQLAALYQQLSKDEIQIATYLMQGRLVPEYESLEFNLSTKMVQRALAELLARHQQRDSTKSKTQTNLFGEENNEHFLAVVKTEFKHSGDLGLVAESLIKQLELKFTEKLSIKIVFAHLEKIAADEGQGSQERKVVGLAKLLENLDPLGARYVTRIIMGKVRLGFSTMTLLDALSWAVHGDKSARAIIEASYNKQADVGHLAQVYLLAKNKAARAKALQQYTVKNGVPVVPALAQRLKTTEEIIQKMGQVIMEPKYDGLRAQVHFQRDGETKAYTRSLDNISHMFPELKQLRRAVDCDSCILDGEAIGYDSDDGKLLTFQQTITRRRKHGVQDQASAVPLRFYFFDVLELEGKSLIDQPLTARKKTLDQILTSNQTFQNIPYQTSHDSTHLRQFHHHQLEQGLEGAIFKKHDAPYRGGRKGWRWVKMKEAEGGRGKLSDTLDCVVMGYYLGKGKRAELGIGAILVGVRDDSKEQLKTITKIGTGLTDEQFREMKARADQVVTERKPTQYQVPKGLIPDVWTQPEIVIEVAADEITTSPTHTAGVALRFPRLIKFRDDKGWQAATTLTEVKQLKIT